jgi:hypothetical protein
LDENVIADALFMDEKMASQIGCAKKIQIPALLGFKIADQKWGVP